MKVILAFDSFKGCLTAGDACAAAALGVHRVLPDVRTLEMPMSDGGEGLVNCVSRILPVTPVKLTVHGPLMKPLTASYALSEDGATAYMEMASACGLTLLPEELRDPMKATTYGVGEMLTDALRRGCSKIIMGIGGSATCDGGRGMVDALRDAGVLGMMCPMVVACDVDNPLYGLRGAAHVFGPQKGATHEQVVMLDDRLREFARFTERQLHIDATWADHPGAGAAGGLGYALLAYLKAELRSGIDILLDLTHFDRELADADLVITGEGQSDRQTLMGKVACGVMRRCRSHGVPVWLLSGRVDDPEHELPRCFDVVRSINEGDSRPLSLLLSPEVARGNLSHAVSRVLREKGFPERG